MVVNRNLFIVAALAAAVVMIIASTSAAAAPLASALRSAQNRAKVNKLRAEGKTKSLRVSKDQLAAGVPWMQPERQIIQISAWCTSPFYYDELGSYMTAGGFVQPPSPVVSVQTSEAFVAAHDPASYNISGSVIYFLDSNVTSGVIEISFAAQYDAYSVEVSYDTPENVALVGAVAVGQSAMYNIIVGKNPFNGPSVC